MTEYQQHFSMCVHLHVVPLIFFSSFFFFFFFSFFLSSSFSLFLSFHGLWVLYNSFMGYFYFYFKPHSHCHCNHNLWRLYWICHRLLCLLISHTSKKIVILHFKTLILCIYYSFVYDLWFEHSLVTIFLDIKSNFFILRSTVSNMV